MGSIWPHAEIAPSTPKTHRAVMERFAAESRHYDPRLSPFKFDWDSSRNKKRDYKPSIRRTAYEDWQQGAILHQLE